MGKAVFKVTGELLREKLLLPEGAHIDNVRLSGFDMIEFTVFDDELPDGVTIETIPAYRTDENGNVTFLWNYPVKILDLAGNELSKDDKGD